MRTICIIDVETGGLDPTKDPIVEIAAVSYSLEHRCVLSAVSVLVDEGKGNAAEEINRIPERALRDDGEGLDGARTALFPVTLDADIFVAHRAAFDRSFVANRIPGGELAGVGVPWACSKFDIAWARSNPGADLVHLALAYGVPVWKNHRALTDCLLLAHVFEAAQRGGEDMVEALRLSQRPKVRVVADVPRERNDELKAASFRWDPTAREWWREMFADDVAKLSFPTRTIPLDQAF